MKNFNTIRYVLFLLLLSLFPYEYLYSQEWEFNKLTINDCNCNSYFEYYIDSTSNNILIGCDNEKVLKLNSDLTNCSQIEMSNADFYIYIIKKSLGGQYFIVTINPQLQSGKIYKSYDLAEFDIQIISQNIPIEIINFKDISYLTAVNQFGSTFYKYTDNNFNEFNNLQNLIFDIVNYNDEMVIAVGGTSNIGVIATTTDFVNWNFIDELETKQLRGVKVINDIIYVFGDEGVVIKIDKDLNILDTYRFDENDRIQDITIINDELIAAIQNRTESEKTNFIKTLNLKTSIRDTSLSLFEEIPTKLFSSNGENFLLTNKGSLFSYNKITSVENTRNLINLELHPNPTNGNVNIDLEGIKSISVYNLQMQKVKAIDNIGTDTIDLKELPAGVYFMEVEDVNGDVYFEKVVKE